MTAPRAEPFSRPVRVDTLPREGRDEAVEANAKEREALAKLNRLVDLADLSATYRLTPGAQGRVRVEGTLRAHATQSCVVTLEPVEETIEAAIDLVFAPMPEGGDSATTPDDEDEPDPLVDGKIDLGALAAEFLALNLDPYPRKPGAVFEPHVEDAAETSPFAPLKGDDDKA